MITNKGRRVSLSVETCSRGYHFNARFAEAGNVGVVDTSTGVEIVGVASGLARDLGDVRSRRAIGVCGCGATGVYGGDDGGESSKGSKSKESHSDRKNRRCRHWRCLLFVKKSEGVSD